jgi:hypothetical protein
MAADQARLSLLAFRLSLTDNGSETETSKKITVVLLPLPVQPGNPPPRGAFLSYLES